MQVLRCALPSTHIASNQHTDFELCGVQKVAPCDEREGEPATTRRQRTASPPRHAAEDEYQSDTLGSQYRKGKMPPFCFLRGIRAIRAKIHGGCRDRTRVVGGRRDTSRRTSPRNQEDGVARPRAGAGCLDRTSLAARFSLSLSLSVWCRSSTDSLCTAQPVNRRRRGGRRRETVGDDRGDGEGRRRGLLSLALADLIRGRMLDSGVWATVGPEDRDRDRDRAARPTRPAGTWRPDKVGPMPRWR